MFQITYYIFPMFIIRCLLANSLIVMWILGEVINLYANYVLIIESKETSASDLIQYIFVILRVSVVLLIRIISDSIALIFVRLWGKLRIVPFHIPMVNMISKVQPNVIVVFFIIPKLPYFMIRSELNPYVILFPILSFLMIFTRSLSNKETLGFAVSVSSMTILAIFSVSIIFRLIIFIITIVWRDGVRHLYNNGNIANKKIEVGVILNILLPVPRGYSWLAKVLVTKYFILSYASLVIFAIVSCLSAWFILSIFFKHFSLTRVSIKRSPYKHSFFIIYYLALIAVRLF